MMDTMEKLYPGIATIECCSYNELSISPVAHYQVGDRVMASAEFVQLCKHGLAKLEVDAKEDNKTLIYTSTLSFFTTEIPTHVRSGLCYKLTDIHGNKYLMGTPERPLTLWAHKQSIPDQTNKRRGYDVTITYKNTHSLLELSE